MPTNYVSKFNLNGNLINVKDASARSALGVLEAAVENSDTTYQKLHGKKILVMGDSLTSGSGQAAGNTWLEMLGERYGATVYNRGISGAKISTGGDTTRSSDYANRIDYILQEFAKGSLDYFIVQGGANDKNDNVPLGGITSVGNSTFCGAVRNIIVKIQRHFEGTCRVLFMTTYHRYDTVNDLQLSEIDYVNAMKKCCAQFSIPCFDNYSDCGIALNTNEYVNPQNLWADRGYVETGTADHHFSVAAYEYLMPVYAQFLVNASSGNGSKPLPQKFNFKINDNTYDVTFAKIIDESGAWHLYGTVVLDGITFPNQIDDGDEWYYSDNINVVVPDDVMGDQTVFRSGVKVSVWTDEGFVVPTYRILSETNNIRVRLMRYKGSLAATLCRVNISMDFFPPTGN